MTQSNYPTGVSLQTTPIYDFSPIHQRRTIISNSDILTLPTTSAVIVPAHLPNVIILPTFVTFLINFPEGDSYDNVDAAGYYKFLINTATNLYGTITLGNPNTFGLTDGASSGNITTFSVPTFSVASGNYLYLTEVAGKSLEFLIDNNGMGDLEEGSDLNTLVVTTEFKLLNIDSGLFI